MELFKATDFTMQMTSSTTPLAMRMRPQSLSDLMGQEHLLGPNTLLPRLIQTNSFGSILLYGPPGCGKTSLAEAIANETDSQFVRLNAVLSNVAELRDVLKLSRHQAKPTTLFIDEIHRFNKAQQDLLLPDVEAGNIRLIGATTHNPGFYIIPPLLSRSHLFKLEPLAPAAVITVLKRAMENKEGLANYRISVEEPVFEGLAQLSEGDLRRALNALETLVLSQPIGGSLTEESLKVFAKERHIRYDRNEDEHHDTISAFIKSIRGNAPDAALYWLAKMLEGGEDPRFIGRRLVILASEDVGLADSRGLPLATGAFQACETVGAPECHINLAHATVFLATAPKSNTAYMGLRMAQAEIRQGHHQPVPQWLRSSGGAANKRLEEGKGYAYSHDYDNNVSGQEYMTNPKQFYFPQKQGAEASIAERLEYWKGLKEKNKESSI